MEQSNSYTYFAFNGDNFDPEIITKELGIKPTNSWRTGDQKRYVQQQKYSCSRWELRSTINEALDINKLVREVVIQLKDKIEVINKLKREYQLDSVLEMVIFVEMDEQISTPMLGHDLMTIEFLFKTRTETDVDIYRA